MNERSFIKCLEGRAALVTGAGRGIGREVALGLAREGAAVALVARSEGEIGAVAAEIETAGGRAKAYPCDVTDGAAVAAMARRAVEDLGPVQVLVNNAGIAESAPFPKTSDDLWHRTMRTNVDSAFYVTRALIGGMVEKGWGRVINVASIAGKHGAPYISAYVTSKHAMIGLTRALASEYAKTGITVNAVCPGYVETPMTQGNVKKLTAKTGRAAEDIRAHLAGQSPQGRIFTAEEVAEVVISLTREGWRGVNGQAIVLDGGEIQS
jgi:NAD(P)-dependent dehydrogenase (short-subunit alcohol dehydrogenase family)